VHPPDSIRWLFIDFNSYFASVEQQLRPELRGKPIAVVPLETDATCAIAASYEAKAYGIKTGTPIYEAKRLCPDLVCVLANHKHYVEYHERILEEIDRHIPVTEVGSIDEMACELDESERNVETAIALAKRIKQGCAKRVGEYILCSIGLAPNRFLAKIATEMQKPDGLVVITPHDIPHKLFALNFKDIPGLGRSMQARLVNAGITTIEELYNIPPKHMRAIWHSVTGERMWYMLRGYELESASTTRRCFGHSHVLAPENRPVLIAHLIGQRLLLKAVSRMRRLGYAASVLTLSIRIEKAQRLEVELKFRPLSDHLSLQNHFEMGWVRLVKAANIPRMRIKKIAVTLHGLVLQETVQPDLFDDVEARRLNVKHQSLSDAMDALNQKYGKGTITTAATLGRPVIVTGTKIAFSRIPDKEEFDA
jgi:DNA polymerase IV